MAPAKILETVDVVDTDPELDLAQPMQSAAMEAANLLRAIGSPHRLMILCHLMEREMTVTDLCNTLGLRQSLVSQHLTHLRLNNLVTSERRGHFSYYTLTNEPAREIVSVLYRHFCTPNAAASGDCAS